MQLVMGPRSSANCLRYRGIPHDQPIDRPCSAALDDQRNSDPHDEDEELVALAARLPAPVHKESVLDVRLESNRREVNRYRERGESTEESEEQSNRREKLSHEN